MVAKDFVVNRHGRLVFPSNAWPRLDFSVFDTVGQLNAAVSRDFEAKAPSASQIVSRLAEGAYPSRYEFLRDLGLHAFWVNRFAITMYDKRTLLAKDIYEQIQHVFGARVFETVITKSVRLEESPAYRESIFTFAPRSTGAYEYYRLSEEVLSRV